MKRTAPLLLLTFVVLLAGVPASAATAAAAATPEAPALGLVANMSPAPASPGCAAPLSGVGTAPVRPAAFNTCGTCSQTVCQGAVLHSSCGYKNGHWYECEPVLGNTCGGGGLTWDCSCWYGPLP